MTIDKSLAVKALSPTFVSAATATPKTAKASPLALDLSFDAVIDTINPLQHLPLVSALYREASGDSIGLAARAGGGFLYGGPIGLAAEMASAVFEATTGDTPLGHVRSALAGDPAPSVAAAPRPFPWMPVA